MSDEPNPSPRDMMRSLYEIHGDDETAVCEAYADAERAGEVKRESQDRGEFAESYARRLWQDGKAKGWLA